MATTEQTRPPEKKPLSLFDLPLDFFDSSSFLFSDGSSTQPSVPSPPVPSTSSADALTTTEARERGDSSRLESKGKELLTSRWTCNTCRAEFDSLLDQRSHFKSDLHRLNVKLSIAGKKCVKEEDLDGLETENSAFLETLDVSSISGSDDESEDESAPGQRLPRKNRDLFKQKLFFHLNNGDLVSVWRCLLLDEAEEISQSSDGNKPEQTEATKDIGQNELINRMKQLISEPRDKTCLRIVFLVSGGHFAGCVFDGKSILAHKTFHRYVVRAKAGKKQSAKDASGKVAHSAGSSIRRHNEAALKKEVQDLVISWKPYFDMCKCILMHAPSSNRQMLFDGGKIQSIIQGYTIRNVPLTVRRPTFKEAKRVYNHLSQVNFEIKEEVVPSEDNEGVTKEPKENKKKGETLNINGNEIKEICSVSSSGKECPSDVIMDQTGQLHENEITLLHLAAKLGDATRTMDLLEQGLNPCIRDERGKTPYMVATDKEVRNTFRRFMALNLDKWDWHAANVPSALTKEMEESQAAKQAEKDAKRKARAKELKKLKKAKEKEKEKEKAKAQASVSQKDPAEVSRGQPSGPVSATKQKQPLNPWKPPGLLSEEERKKQLAEEREKRAAAAERRMAALKLQGASQPATPSNSDPNNGASDVNCAYCHSSLVGKVPFHRYNYKYCSPTCMHVHGETLQAN